MRTGKICTLIILALLMSACSLGQPAASQSEVTPPALPTKGQSTITGRVLSRETGDPMPDEIVRLAEVYRQGDKGAYVLDMAFSPGARTDDKGYFIFENIPAKEYVIMVGNYDAMYDIIEEEGTSKPKVYAVQADQILDVGELEVKLEYH